MAKKSMMDYMKARNSMQLMGGNNPDNTVVLDSKVKQMPKEEGIARKKAYNEKFGNKYAPAKPLKGKPAPIKFGSREEMQEYFKKNPR